MIGTDYVTSEGRCPLQCLRLFPIKQFLEKKRSFTFQALVKERLCIGNEDLEEHSMVPFCVVQY